MVYRNGEFHEALSDDCDKTWSYAPYLKKRENIEFFLCEIEAHEKKVKSVV